MAKPVSFNPPSPEDLSNQLSGFEVEELIAQGGMGAVFRGVQSRLDRPVAIKVLPREAGAKYGFAEMFEAEAKAMAKLTHNYIVGVYDYGSTPDGSLLYFVMEYVDGTNLHDAIHSGEWELTHKVALLARVCEAIEFAHHNGVIHRDIKPANILIDRGWNPKVADFGLASIAGGPEQAVIFGTPGYFAPECKDGGIGDFRVDIFALGALVYETLTKIPPDEESAPPSMVAPDVPREFDAIVSRARHPMPGQRYPSAGEMGSALLEAYKSATKPVASTKLKKPVLAAPAAKPTSPQSARPHFVAKPARGGSGGWMLVLVTALIAGVAIWAIVAKQRAHQNSTSKSPGGSSPELALPLLETGPVKVFGSWQGSRKINLGFVVRYDDFKQVTAFRSFTYALRENGQLVNLRTGKSLEDIRSVFGHSFWAAIITDEGKVIDADGRRLEIEGLEKVKDVAGGSYHWIALLGDGTVKVWGKAYGSEKSLTYPPRTFSGVVRVAASGDSALIVDQDGRAIAWDTENKVARELVVGEPVVDARGGIAGFVLLTKSGSVYEVNAKLTEVTKPEAAELPGPFIAIRRGGTVSAAQKEDHTWVAWGVQADEIIDQVQSLPPTFDLSLYADPGGEYGSVLWIER